jgi:environmental stress-induced protein Ves
MIRHLTQANYRPMPWANGKGITVEMLRVDRAGMLTCRLSRASVVEDGDFSQFPGIERNLTVISGPGFDLVGQGIRLAARPLEPVAFAGDVAIRAQGVSAPSDDFNVMTARDLPRPQVRVMDGGQLAAGSMLAVFALGVARIAGVAMAQHDLVVTDEAVSIQGRVIAVRIFGLVTVHPEKPGMPG